MWHGMRRPDGLADPHMYITPFRLYDVRMGRWNTRDPIFDPSASPYEGMGSNPISLTDVLGLNPADYEVPEDVMPRNKEIVVTAPRDDNAPKPNKAEFESAPLIYGQVVHDPSLFGEDLFFNQRNKYHDNGDGTGSMIRPFNGGDLALVGETP